MSRPNLFAFATSELSQDAFICWLLSWADPRCAATDGALHDTAVRMLKKLLETAGIESPEVFSEIVIRRQYHHIDILVEINSGISLIIEDKTFTKAHSEQLTRYIDDMRKEHGSRTIAGIFLKTGDQGSYEAVKAAGFAVFGRSDLIKILESGLQAGVRNEIFNDFSANLQDYERSVQSYKTRAPKDWDSNCWVGFFLELQDRLRDGDWDYVNNAGGGFMGFWWHSQGYKYLQLEQEKLCFKIEVQDKALRADEWEKSHSDLMRVSGSGEITLRPGESHLNCRKSR